MTEFKGLAIQKNLVFRKHSFFYELLTKKNFANFKVCILLRRFGLK